MELIYLAVLGAAFYMLIIRPQTQRTKQMRQLLDSLTIGDQVVTIGGLHGSIVELEESRVVLRVHDDVLLTFEKSAVARKDAAPEDESPAASDAEADST